VVILLSNIVRGLKNTVPGAAHPSGRTENADLSASNWTASTASPLNVASALHCPRAFIPNYSGTLVFKGKDDSADRTLIVNAGSIYPISIQSITRASCSAALQVANALLLLY
jgi:hypothetical protein